MAETLLKREEILFLIEKWRRDIKGTDPKFWSKIAIIFFFCEKASSGMWEICPKILGGYEY